MTLQRRSFLSLLGAPAAAWPLAARAQQDARIRRVAVLFASADRRGISRTGAGAAR